MTISELRQLKSASYYNKSTTFASFTSFFDLLTNISKVRKNYLKNFLENEFDTLHKKRKTLSRTNPFFSEFYKNDIVFANNIYDKLIKHIAEEFSIDNYPSLYIVDNLPKPFNKYNWNALTIDKQDEHKYNVKRGIYFSRNYLTHVFFETTLIHEILHWIISEYSMKTYKITYFPIIEEGICDFYALFYFKKLFNVDDDLLLNWIVFNRTYPYMHELWNSYWKSLNNVSEFVDSFGQNELSNLLKKGRNYFNKIISSTGINKDSACMKKTDTCKIISKANRIFYVTLEEYIILQQSIKSRKAAMSKEDLMSKTKMPKKLFNLAISSLKDTGLLYIENKNIIQPNDNYFLSPKNIRYYIRP